MQKKIVRLITGASFLEHTSPLFFETKILKINDINKFILAQFMYSSIKVSSDFIFYPSHSYETRGHNNVVPQYQRLTVCQHSPMYAGPILWNNLPEEIRAVETVYKFKKLLKNHLLKFYLD